MYDPMNPPAAGIPADPLPDDLPEGDSGEVTDDDVEEPIFENVADEVAGVGGFLYQDEHQETDDDA